MYMHQELHKRQAPVKRRNAQMDPLAPEAPAALSPDAALRILGRGVISRASFYKAINRGEVPHRRLGKRIIIPRAKFLRWLETAAVTVEGGR
jgi:predicted DNA-binding transcriptional regulator AlpA